MINHEELELVLSEDKIQAKIKEMAADLDKRYEGKKPVVIGIMRGSLYFMSDLTKEMKIDLEVDVMSLSSYGLGSKSSGNVKILKDVDIDLVGRHVLVLEDIVDTGTTLKYLKEYFERQSVASVETISIFQKKGTNIHGNAADMIGFELPDSFLVGYGLDYANRYRHLKNVYILNLP